jgi:hypothetical protein
MTLQNNNILYYRAVIAVLFLCPDLKTLSPVKTGEGHKLRPPALLFLRCSRA